MKSQVDALLNGDVRVNDLNLDVVKVFPLHDNGYFYKKIIYGGY